MKDATSPIEAAAGNRAAERNRLETLNGSLDRIYRTYRRQLFTCALAVTRCPDRAEDAIQEAFYRLFRLESKPRSLKAYVFRTVRNAAVDQVKRNPPPRGDDELDYVFDPGENPRELAAGREFQRRVARAMLDLSEDQRETIVQHIYGDLTLREIAEVHEVPVGTVAAWYHRGIRKLRAKLEE